MPVQLPIGTIMPFAGDVTNPTTQSSLLAAGWLPCLGGTYPTSGQFAPLYALIGNTYGGDASNFAVPDLRGTFVRGVDPSGTLTGPIGTSQSYATALPRSEDFATSPADPHSHQASFLPNRSNNSERSAGFHMAEWSDGAPDTTLAGKHTHRTQAPGTAGAGGDAETRPVNVYCDYIIKYQ